MKKSELRELVVGARLISFVRRPKEILAFINEPVRKTEEPQFDVKSLPLDQLKPSIYPGRERLEEYLSHHPATVAWYRIHKAVSRELWERGLPWQSQNGEFTIQVEQDPLEILKLGTYTGTCLGVGGLCSDSAVAALLDVNKKVLYARDRRGRAVARQLLAISDDDRLVCFSIYPLSASPAIKSAFREYDQAFARALVIPMYDPADSSDAGYQVSSVLSVYWWDDGSWDFNTSA